VSEHRSPESVALGFISIIQEATPGWNGRSLNIEDFLSKE
jgi:hypothetical protein